MRIWIDGYEANVLQRLGSSQVAFELIKNLEKIDQKNEYTILLPSPPLEDLPRERKGWSYRILKPKRLWTQISLPLALYSAKEKPDLIFSPTHYIPRFSPVKRIVTIFDLAFLHFPEMFVSRDLWQLKNWTHFSAKNADHIITISQFSKKDIVKQYGLDKDNITVAYPGYNQENFQFPISNLKLKEIKNKYKTGENYIIYVGTLQPRKNLLRLIEAFEKVAKDNKELNLVVVGKAKGEGKEGWKFEEILQAPKSLGIEDRVKFLGFVPLDDLPSLLSGSIAFVQPSLWEGFGIPVIEAMACGTPAIVSNVSSLPEVAGQAGLLVDPYSINQIEQAIRTIVADKRLRHNLSQKGLKQAKKFSWRLMAKEVLKTFSV